MLSFGPDLSVQTKGSLFIGKPLGAHLMFIAEGKRMSVLFDHVCWLV